MEILFAKGKAFSPSLGKSVIRKSNASCSLIELTEEPLLEVLQSLPQSGVRGGVERLGLILPGIGRGPDWIGMEMPRDIGDAEDLEVLKLDVVEREIGYADAVLSLTQFDDPRSGGHLTLGVSKTPPRPSTEGGRIVVDVAHALKLAHSERIRPVVKAGSPIPNGVTTVGGAKTRLGIYKIGFRS